MNETAPYTSEDPFIEQQFGAMIVPARIHLPALGLLIDTGKPEENLISQAVRTNTFHLPSCRQKQCINAFHIRREPEMCANRPRTI
jgi:hypothetical protein